MDKKEESKKHLIYLEKNLQNVNMCIKILTSELDNLIKKQDKLNLAFSEFKKNINAENEEEKMAKEITKSGIKVIQLKNGQVNVPFEEQIDLSDYDILNEFPVEFEGIENISWNKEKSRFEGIPAVAGEFFGKILYWNDLNKHLDQELPLEREVHFLVNPDPRSLWECNEPPADSPFPKEHTNFSLIKFRNSKIVSVSVRGKSHAHKGTHRDDHVISDFFKDTGWSIQIVSDGAGSAQYSRKGSQIACEIVIEKITSFLSETDLVQFEKDLKRKLLNESDTVNEVLGESLKHLTIMPAYEAQKAIYDFAKKNDHVSSDFASTLLFAISKRFSFGRVVISFSIGDGAIGAVKDNSSKLLMTPDSGEFSGQTIFITMPEIFQSENAEILKSRIGITLFAEGLDSLILMSDGISDPKFGTDKNLNDPQQWINLWDEINPLLQSTRSLEESLLEWMDFYTPGEYDDRTISILF